MSLKAVLTEQTLIHPPFSALMGVFTGLLLLGVMVLALRAVEPYTSTIQKPQAFHRPSINSTLLTDSIRSLHFCWLRTELCTGQRAKGAHRIVGPFSN